MKLPSSPITNDLQISGLVSGDQQYVILLYADGSRVWKQKFHCKLSWEEHIKMLPLWGADVDVAGRLPFK